MAETQSQSTDNTTKVEQEPVPAEKISEEDKRQEPDAEENARKVSSELLGS
ncbi:hypothetical protein M231_07429 [Tremella mesenterica]|uniref:Uncharacterized protein n=1 Tax=Tremella mesenterica TaxID=5217 RepID=A0A4Q1BC12_TREME|nr:hypothetical protein M231_07429 [Tremella mesenterica]